MRTICERAWSPAWWVGVGVLFLGLHIDIRIYRVHTKDMTTTENIQTIATTLLAQARAYIATQAKWDSLTEAEADKLSYKIVARYVAA